MEARLIDEITQIQATLGLDLLGPAKTASLAGASVEALGHLADRHEWFALLYRRLAVHRGRTHRGEADPGAPARGWLAKPPREVRTPRGGRPLRAG